MANVVSTFFTVTLWAAVSLVAVTASRDFLIMAFGDQLSDTGIMYNFTHGKVPRSPYYWEGRFTNSPGNWQDWINGLNVDAIQSKNYAIGGAHACQRWDLPGIEPVIPTVGEQAAFLVLKAFVDPSLLGNRTALPLIWAGHNDVIEMNGLSPSRLAKLPRDTANCVLHTAKLFLAARIPFVVVGTLAPVELSPLGNGNKTMAAAVRQINKLIKKGVSDLQVELSKQGHKNQSVLLWDVNDFLVQAFKNYKSSGFKHNASCQCLTYKPGENLLNGVPIAECSKPDDYIYFDNINPTSKVHRLMSEHLLRTLARGGVSSTALTALLHRDRMLGQRQHASLLLQNP